MTQIDARLDTGELAPTLVLQTERSHGTVLDIEFAPHVTVNGSPDGFREFARDLLDLVDMVSPPAGDVFDDIPPYVTVVSDRWAGPLGRTRGRSMTGCGCAACLDRRDGHSLFRGMVVCETCGNKRCPHATNHVHACTGGNEPGQPGSAYGPGPTGVPS